MAEHNLLGQAGEEAACLYLAERSYRLLARNWRSGRLEIDIVADYFGELVFVEVKTRRNEDYLPAAAAVDHEKREHLLRAARSYMNVHHLDQPFRFDIITVVGERRPFRIEQIVNAFNRTSVEAEGRPRRPF